MNIKIDITKLTDDELDELNKQIENEQDNREALRLPCSCMGECYPANNPKPSVCPFKARNGTYCKECAEGLRIQETKKKVK